jgi:hypothetical protein
MTPADFERLRSWAVDIAATLLPGRKFRDEGDERRFIGEGGLSINRKNGAWFHHAAGTGSLSTAALVAHIKKCRKADAERWAEAWLGSPRSRRM